MLLTINGAIDDVHPEKNWMINGDQSERWLNKLYDEFGIKWNLFIPSNYHNKFPISKYKSWITDISHDPKFEICCHGHFHQTSNPLQYGEMEFVELNYDQAVTRISMMREEWESVGIIPIGFRPPGWVVNIKSHQVINNFKVNTDSSASGCNWFKYVAVHYEHNRNLQWDCKTFFGHDGIQQEHIEIHNISPDGETGMIMFQSHIAGKHNHNVWNEENYNQLRMSLTHLFENYDITPKTLKECL